MVPLKPYSYKKCGRYCRFLARKVFISVSFSIASNKQQMLRRETANENKQSFQDTVINQALPCLRAEVHLKLR